MISAKTRVIFLSMNEFWLCFVPLFVAVDAIGVLPIFISLTETVERDRLKTIIMQSILTASLVAIVFMVIGPALLRFLGITVGDFMIAGGILLLAFSLNDLLTGEKKQRQADLDTLGAVPLGVPLITGPAVLTTCILLANAYGRTLTAVAVLINVAIAGLIFGFARPITKRIGNAGSKAISKIASLLLASIAIMLVRKGILDVIAAFIQQ